MIASHALARPRLSLSSLGLIRTNLLAVALLLAACVAESVQVIGPYADRLSDADIQQIKLAASKDLDGRLRKIEAFRRDKVRIQIGPELRYAISTVIKRNGKRLVNESAGVEAVDQRPIVTY